MHHQRYFRTLIFVWDSFNSFVNFTPDTRPHAPVLLYALEHAASCMRRGALRLRVSRYHVFACVQILSGLQTG